MTPTTPVVAPSQQLNGLIIRSTVVAALGGLLFGFDTAVVAGITKAITAAYSLTPASLGWTVAVALVGTVLGSLLAGYPGDRFGRRDSLRGLAVLYLVTAVGCALAWDWYSLLFFRFIGGLAIGGSSVLGPMYIAEISPARWRGRMVGFFQFNIVFGILLAYFSNFVLGTLALGGMEWRWKLGIAAVPALLFLLMLIGIPRSPRWLVKKHRHEEARQVLTNIGETDVEGQLQAIVDSMAFENGGDRLFQHKYRKPVQLAIMVAFFNQVSGINAILYYLNDIFERAGLSKVSGDLQAVPRMQRIKSSGSTALMAPPRARAERSAAGRRASGAGAGGTENMRIPRTGTLRVPRCHAHACVGMFPRGLQGMPTQAWAWHPTLPGAIERCWPRWASTRTSITWPLPLRFFVVCGKAAESFGAGGGATVGCGLPLGLLELFLLLLLFLLLVALLALLLLGRRVSRLVGADLDRRASFGQGSDVFGLLDLRHAEDQFLVILAAPDFHLPLHRDRLRLGGGGRFRRRRRLQAQQVHRVDPGRSLREQPHRLRRAPRRRPGLAGSGSSCRSVGPGSAG